MANADFDAYVKVSYERKKGRENRYTYYIIRIPRESVMTLGGLSRNELVHVKITDHKSKA